MEYHNHKLLLQSTHLDIIAFGKSCLSLLRLKLFWSSNKELQKKKLAMYMICAIKFSIIIFLIKPSNCGDLSSSFISFCFFVVFFCCNT